MKDETKETKQAEQTEQAEPKTNPKPSLGKLENKVDMLAKLLAKLEREVNAITERFETADQTTEEFISKITGRLSTLENRLSKTDGQLIDTNTMLNRLNNTVNQLTKAPGSFEPDTVGSVLGRTNNGQFYWFASALKYSEAVEAVKSELEERKGYTFTFVPQMPKID